MARTDTNENAMIPIYSFGHGIIRGTAWVGPSPEHPGPRLMTCKVCGIEWPIFPLGARPRAAFNITKPGTVDDVVGNPLSFSERARRAIQKAGLTGCRFVQPHGYRCKGDGPAYRRTVELMRDVLRYRVAWVTGIGGSIAKTHRLRRMFHCSACGQSEWSLPRGLWNPLLKVDVCQWDGSDFFRVEEWGAKLFTQRAADVLAAEGLSNFTADPAGYVIDPRRPVRLPSRKERVQARNIYLLSCLYGTASDRAKGIYKPFWTDFFAGRLGERTFRNALAKLRAFRPSGRKTIEGWRWYR